MTNREDLKAVRKHFVEDPVGRLDQFPDLSDAEFGNAAPHKRVPLQQFDATPDPFGEAVSGTCGELIPTNEYGQQRVFGFRSPK